jgi:hypothetical protein
MGDYHIPRMGPLFNPKMLVKLRILVWCILKMLLMENRLVEGIIAERVGKVLGEDSKIIISNRTFNSVLP